MGKLVNLQKLRYSQTVLMHEKCSKDKDENTNKQKSNRIRMMKEIKQQRSAILPALSRRNEGRKEEKE